LGKHGKWLFCTAAPLRDADGRVIGAIEILQDMTTRWLAELELKASEARYRQLFESAHDAILIIKNGVIVDCNQEALNLTGFSRKMLIGRSPLNFSPVTQPDGVTSKALLEEKTAIAFQDRPQQFDWRIRRNNGDHIDVEVSLTRFKIGDTPHGLAIVRDVTHRKKMMRALEDRERELNEKTRYLEKVNQALKDSLDHREIEKRSIEEHLLVNLKRLICPYLEDLRQCRLDADAETYVNIINTHINDMATQVSRTLSAKYMDFTPTEIRIADFIRDGKNTKEIAMLLNLSPSSVQWHRKNIREKLGLTHKKTNLCTFLTSLEK
jgi:PAS domain S-box-containing protein